MQDSSVAKIALTVMVVVGGLSFFIYKSMKPQHYKMVDELMADDLSRWEGKEMKVHGWVQAGTIHEKTVGQETRRTFLLQKSGKAIRVFSAGPKPDTFKDQSEVVATGHLVPKGEMKAVADQLGVPLETAAYVLDSSELMAKCPSKYDGAPSNKTKFD